MGSDPALHWRGDQPPRPDHRRHGRHRALLPRCARLRSWSPRSARQLPPLLLQLRRADHGGVLRVRRRRRRVVRQAGGRARPAGRSSSTTCRSTCPTRTRSSTLRDRLKQRGCEVTDVVDHGFVRSVYFTDPNGIALEASWWTSTRRAGRPTTATTACSATPSPCRRSTSCAPPASSPTSPTPVSSEHVLGRRARHDVALPHHPRRQPAPARQRSPSCTVGAAGAKRSTPTSSGAAVEAATAAVIAAPGRGRHRRRQRRRAGAGELLHLRPAPDDRVRRGQPPAADARPARAPGLPRARAAPPASG